MKLGLKYQLHALIRYEDGKITCKRQNHSFMSHKKALFQTLQRTKKNNLVARVHSYSSLRSRGTQREYSSKPLQHRIVKRILVFKR